MYWSLLSPLEKNINYLFSFAYLHLVGFCSGSKECSFFVSSSLWPHHSTSICPLFLLRHADADAGAGAGAGAGADADAGDVVVANRIFSTHQYEEYQHEKGIPPFSN